MTTEAEYLRVNNKRIGKPKLAMMNQFNFEYNLLPAFLHGPDVFRVIRLRPKLVVWHYA